jgi:nitroreductase
MIRLLRQELVCVDELAISTVEIPAPSEAAWLPNGLEARRSCRRFTETPIPSADLYEVVDHGLWFSRALSEGVPALSLEAVVSARNVEGLAPGVYRVPNWTDSLAAPEEAELVPGDDFENVGAYVHLCADFSALSDSAEAGHLYRMVMAGAGAALLAMWLRAASMTLGGCICAGIHAPGLRAVSANDLALRPLATLVLGAADLAEPPSAAQSA